MALHKDEIPPLPAREDKEKYTLYLRKRVRIRAVIDKAKSQGHDLPKLIAQKIEELVIEYEAVFLRDDENQSA